MSEGIEELREKYDALCEENVKLREENVELREENDALTELLKDAPRAICRSELCDDKKSLGSNWCDSHTCKDCGAEEISAWCKARSYCYTCGREAGTIR